MLDSETKVAYGKAIELSLQMEESLIEQQEIVVALDQSPPADEAAILEQRLSEVRIEWLKLSGQYTTAVGTYNAAVDKARRLRDSRNGL